MLEPQSTVLLVLLVAAFGVLMWWMLRTGRAALRVLAAGLAFLIATSFGVMAVNKYYGYYETWGAAVGDLASSGVTGVNAVPQARDSDLPSRGPHDISKIYRGLARQQGYTLRMVIAGPRSHITRVVYVYLPPQYFQAPYQGYRFPVIELIHGQPGEPQDWIDVAGVTATLDDLVRQHRARPAVLVMPDANGGEDVSLQCLNQVGGPQDLTYLAEDLPDQIARLLRVQPPGPAWGVAGYSEGGYCAANIGLQLRQRYGFAGVLSGYFSPFDNQLAHPVRLVSPFRGHRGLRRDNTPLDEVQDLPGGAIIPQFWLGAGQDDRLDVANAEFFRQELQLRQADVPLTLTRGGGHDMATWRAELPRMLSWMTKGLARAAQRAAAGRPAPGAVPACGSSHPASGGQPRTRSHAHPRRTRPRPPGPGGSGGGRVCRT
jgi:enterochelin esterase-like enzyme